MKIPKSIKLEVYRNGKLIEKGDIKVDLKSNESPRPPVSNECKKGNILPNITTEEWRIDNVRQITDKSIGEVIDYGKGHFLTSPNANLFIEKTQLKSEIEFCLKAGTYSLSPNYQNGWGFDLRYACLQLPPLMIGLGNTQLITHEATKFFDKLDLYDKHGMRKMRSLLLYSLPGMGKTASINRSCQDWVDKGEALVLFLDSSDEPDFIYALRNFFEKIKLPKKVDKLFLIIEDVNGYIADDEDILKRVSPRLLSLLDGNTSIFSLPTFLIMTTNFGNAIPLPLLRPGRVDKIMLLKPPTQDEQVQLLKFFAGSPEHLYELAKLNGHQDKDMIIYNKLKPYEMFGPAHLKEVVFRAELDEISLFDAAKNIKEEFMDIQLKSGDLKKKMLENGKSQAGFGRDEPDLLRQKCS